MKIKNFVRATNYDVYIYSLHHEGNYTPEQNKSVSNLLLGISGIADLTIHKFIIEPEDLAIYVLVDLPQEIIESIYNYNKSLEKWRID